MLSLEELKTHAMSLGGYNITPKANDLQDLKDLLHNMQNLRGLSLYNGELSLGDLKDEFDSLTSCTCDAKAVRDSDGGKTQEIGCSCDNRCSCDSLSGCSCDSRCTNNSLTDSIEGCICNRVQVCQCHGNVCICVPYVFENGNTAYVYGYCPDQTIAGFGCACRLRCLCNVQYTCECDNRCSCNTQKGCTCDNRCTCDVVDTCACDTRCSCNTQRIFG